MARFGLLGALVFSWPAAAFAGELDGGDTAWVLTSSALVLLMTPGLALFYGGMVRRKNVLSTMMHSFVCMGAASLTWAVVGYTLAFGDDIGGVVGDFSKLMLAGVGTDVGADATIPDILFMAFQGMFVIITVALISGAYAERIRFDAMVLFSIAWVVLVYAPVCHWVWGGGWLGEDGALDFAGGTVVHINSAAAALAAVLLLGSRRGFPTEPMPPNNIPFTMIGGGLLWFGWLGFNGGSALAADGTAALAVATTNLAAAAGMVFWLLTDVVRHGKPTALGSVSGAVAGLVAITPACAFVTPSGAIVLGAIAGVACNYAITLRHRAGLDDSLDVIGIHGLGGTIGALLVAFLCVPEHLVEGGRGAQFLVQLISVVATIVYSVVVSGAILLLLKSTIGLRVEPDAEQQGLDVSVHGEDAYNL